jgi:hypothetical protein
MNEKLLGKLVLLKDADIELFGMIVNCDSDGTYTIEWYTGGNEIVRYEYDPSSAYKYVYDFDFFRKQINA